MQFSHPMTTVMKTHICVFAWRKLGMKMFISFTFLSYDVTFEINWFSFLISLRTYVLSNAPLIYLLFTNIDFFTIADIVIIFIILLCILPSSLI
jgi:hypothetical protein